MCLEIFEKTWRVLNFESISKDLLKLIDHLIYSYFNKHAELVGMEPCSCIGSNFDDISTNNVAHLSTFGPKVKEVKTRQENKQPGIPNAEVVSR